MEVCAREPLARIRSSLFTEILVETRELTGKTQYREHHRLLGRPVYILQVEERVAREIRFPFPVSSLIYRWRDAQAGDFEELNRIDPARDFDRQIRLPLR